MYGCVWYFQIEAIVAAHTNKVMSAMAAMDSRHEGSVIISQPDVAPPLNILTLNLLGGISDPRYEYYQWGGRFHVVPEKFKMPVYVIYI